MFHGSIVALVTPMYADGAVDWASFDKLIQLHLDAGTNGLVVVGTTGESATLTLAEQRSLLQHAVKTVAGRIPVIAGTGAIAVSETIELTRLAMEAGVDACLILTPPYVRPPQDGLYHYYASVASAVPIPQILYNVPSRTACDLLPVTVDKLSYIANIVGIKEATGKDGRVRQIVENCGDRLDVFSGDDETGLESLFAGAKGIISVTANVMPKEMVEMCLAAFSDDRPLARAINARLKWLHEKLFVQANPIPVKWALECMGLIGSGIRLPLTRLDQSHHDTVKRALRHAEVTVY